MSVKDFPTFYVDTFGDRLDGQSLSSQDRKDLEVWLAPHLASGAVGIKRCMHIRRPKNENRWIYLVDLLIFHDDVVAVAFKMMFSDVIVMKYEESHEIYCFETHTWCLM
jgi:hypothetical protein